MSSSSSSSSSSYFCKYPECSGDSCNHFYDWYLGLPNESSVIDGKIYVRFNTFGSVQQVELYKDSGYFLLIGIGQGSSSPIQIQERNNSGINGSVEWDGFLVGYPNEAILHCFDISSSSSSSSFDSSSSSSTSSSSESSESSGCCDFLYCSGTYCSNLTNWDFSGFSKGNSTYCKLYVGLEYFISEDLLGTIIIGSGFVAPDPVQQVRIYKDEDFNSLVAIGQSPVSGEIILNEVNNSGLTGTVEWDGTPIFYPNFVYLDCSPFSSSSSSSSSSIDSSSSSSIDSSSSSSSSVDSSSSSSSSSFGYSSSSSTSESSESSETSNSTSSSSSIDSSSTSSESFLNISSSSSSEYNVLNRSKPITYGHSAISNGSTINRLAQTISVESNTYAIDSIYLFILGPFGGSRSYEIEASIYSCDENGTPETLLHSSNINASDISENNWNEFSFNKTLTLSNQYIGVVLQQIGGDENNYILWGHNLISSDNEIAWIYSSNQWFKESVQRSLRIMSSYDPINLEDFYIESKPASEKTLNQNLLSDSQSQSQSQSQSLDGRNLLGYELENVEVNEEEKSLSIKYPPLALSFLIDNSGSMGWNDRFNDRKLLIDSFIENIKENYPSEVIFDMIGFGGAIINTDASQEFGKVATINLDTSEPDYKEFLFYLSEPANVIKGEIYVHNDSEYSADISFANSELIKLMGNVEPLNSGILTLSGGSKELNFFKNKSPSINDNFVAYGLTSFESYTSPYIVGELMVDDSIISPVELNNVELYFNDNENPNISLSDDGPFSTEAVSINASPSLVFRKYLTTTTINSSNILADINIGDTAIEVEDASVFKTNQLIDIVGREHIIVGLEILSIDDNNITINRASQYKINKSSICKMVPTGLYLYKSILGTTIKLLIKTDGSTAPITFYLQNQDGLKLEWEVTPYSDWIINNFAYIDETASLPISVNAEGFASVPNGTRIDMSLERDTLAKQEIVKLLTKDALASESKIYVSDTDGLSVEDVVRIFSDKSFSNNNEIISLGEDDEGEFIRIENPLKKDFLVLENAKMSLVSIPIDDVSDKNLTSVKIPLVDVTPIEVGKDLDPLILDPYDPPSIDKDFAYESASYTKEQIRRGYISARSIDGHATVRILPITEDIIQTEITEGAYVEEILQGKYKYKPISQDIKDELDLESLNPEEAPTPEDEVDDSYYLESPIYTDEGNAVGSMRTYNKNDFEIIYVRGVNGYFNQKFEAMGIKYEVYPSIKNYSSNGTLTSRNYLDSFSIDFLNNISIFNNFESRISYHKYIYESELPQCPPKLIGEDFVSYEGVFPNEEAISVDYIVTDKMTLLNTGRLRVRVYANYTFNQESWVDKYNSYEQHSNYINKIYQDGDELSKIDRWRFNIENALYQEVISSASLEKNLNWDYVESLVGAGASETLKRFTDRNAELESNLSESESETFDHYENSNGWIVPPQYYSIHNTYIDITNGRAQLVLPPPENEQTIIIEVAHENEAYGIETLKTSLIFVRSPLMIQSVTPLTVGTDEGSTNEFEISSEITWKDGLNGIIEDGTIVEYKTNAIVPKISQTENGFARGSIYESFGVTFSNDSKVGCPTPPIVKTINIVVTHSSGETKSFNRKFVFNPPGDSDSNNLPKYFQVEGSDIKDVFSDGESVGSVSFDLSHPQNLDDKWLSEKHVNYLLSTYVGDIKLPAQVTLGNFGGGLSYVINGEFQQDIPTTNKNIGFPPAITGDEEVPSPWGNKILLYTAYKLDGKAYSATGQTSYPTEEGEDNSPYFYIREPLSIEIESENIYVADGETEGNLIITAYWKNGFINSFYVKNEGLDSEEIISTGMPYVRLQAGVGNEKSINTERRDARGGLNDYMETIPNQNIKLDSYLVQLTLTRTDKYESSLGIHTHACEIDENGNGVTTSTISLSGDVTDDHSHVIENYIVLDNDGPFEIHDHTLRSVAEVNLLPSSKPNITPTIIASIDYDPTNCEPYDGYRSPYSFEPLEGNRMTFTSFTYDSTVGRKFVFEWDGMKSGAKLFMLASQTPFEEENALNLTAKAYYTEYDINLEGGGSTTIPREYIEDGTKINYEVKAYKVEDNDAVTSFEKGVNRKYMVLSVSAYISYGDIYSEIDLTIAVLSPLQWVPFITTMMQEPSNDVIYLDNYQDSFSTLGPSQMMDAIVEASSRLRDDIYDEYSKVFVLLSDGKENESQSSIYDALNNINYFPNAQTVNFFIGDNAYGESIMSVISANTDGIKTNIRNLSEETLTKIINNTLSSLNVNYGYYKNTINLKSPKIGRDINLFNSLIEASNESFVSFKYRYSDDGENWSEWSNWIDSSQSFSIPENKNQFFEFEIRFRGNELFESPKIINPEITLDYYEPSNLIVFFQPINVKGFNDKTDFISSIHITDKSSKNENSDINYKFSQTYSENFEEFIPLKLDENNRILTRYNEPLTTENLKLYKSINGGWASKSKISVYEISGENPKLISESKYMLDADNGFVIFNVSRTREETFVICIESSPVFRLACEIVNFSEEISKVHHIAIMYNMTKRIPTDEKGTIIHTPINKRI
jgi:hypothetical protein